jgi:hypothetical protein
MILRYPLRCSDAAEHTASGSRWSPCIASPGNLFLTCNCPQRFCGMRVRAGCRLALEGISRARGKVVGRLVARRRLRATLVRGACDQRPPTSSPKSCPTPVLQRGHALAPHLTPANHREVLDSARGKKKSEIEAIVARLSPRPDVAASVRKLPTLLQAFAAVEAPVAPGASAMDPAASDPAVIVPPETGHTAEPLSVPRTAVTPLSPRPQ